MGDHVLFQNTSTAKRFPFLATVPQHELSTMFNVPPVDREAEKLKELQYSEPYMDPRVSFRELSSSNTPSHTHERAAGGGAIGGDSTGGGGGGPDGSSAANMVRPAFTPTNAATAKKSILGTHESVFVGTYQDRYLHDQKSFAAASALLVSSRPFSRGGSSLAASELLANTYYLNAMDSEVAQQVREMTKHRIKVNRAIFQDQQQRTHNNNNRKYGGSGDDQSRPALPALAASGPRPMTGSAPPRR